MALVSNPLIGKASGSVGGATFSSWKGKNVLKSKATEVADPKTAAQLSQRSKMSVAVGLFKRLVSIISLGFSQKAIGMSAYNAFISQNLKDLAISTDPTAPFANAANFSVAKGTLDPTAISAAERNVANTEVTVEFSSVSTGDQNDTDEVQCVIIGQNGIVKGISLGNNERVEAQTTVVAFPGQAFAAGDKCYLFFYQSATRKVSDSAFRLVA